jgi:hypothetical protein
MKSLYEYEVLVNDTFYRSWHVLEYIEQHPNMSELDKEAVKATIMDALVYAGAIDPDWEYLDLENCCISGDPAGYEYDIHPNVSSIPMWLKEEMRHKCVKISAGIPVAMYVARPASYPGAYCVYDPNTAVSSLFKDFTFYEAKYVSPTRGVKIEKSRPFVEVDINGELYLVDILTKRIFKTSWFKETYDLEIIDSNSPKKFNRGQREHYKEQTEDSVEIATYLCFTEMLRSMIPKSHKDAEFDYELEQARKNYPEEWEKYRIMEEERDAFFASRKITGV